MLWGIRLPGIPDTTYTEVWRNNSKYEDLQHTGRNNKRTTPDDNTVWHTGRNSKKKTMFGTASGAAKNNMTNNNPYMGNS